MGNENAAGSACVGLVGTGYGLIMATAFAPVTAAGAGVCFAGALAVAVVDLASKKWGEINNKQQ